MADPVNDVAVQLYAVPPRRFVAERDAAVAAARDGGHRDTATALAKLRRPTVSAWLINLLALRAPRRLDELDGVAQALREAQEALDGNRLRELTGERRAVVARLVETVRALAAEADPGQTPGGAAMAEVEAMLQAALTDPAVAAAVRSGRLTRRPAPEGNVELPRPQPRQPAAGPTAGGTAATAGATAEAVAEAARAAFTEARAAAEAARAELAQATDVEERARQELAGIETAMAELADRRKAAQQRLAEATAEVTRARQAANAARRAAGEAEAALP